MNEAWHQYNIRVPYKDTDKMGVVHHGNYVTWFEMARVEWMRHYEVDYQQLEELGFLLPVLGVNVEYHQSARFDDCVALFVKVSNYSPVRLEFYYEARKISEEAFQYGNKNSEPYGELLAKGTTKHMWVKEDWKPARMNRVAPQVYKILEELC